MSFSPLRFSAYARDLERAILNLSNQGMGATAELRKALGRDDVEVRFGGGRQFVTMDDKTVELDANAAPAEVAEALNVTPMPKVEVIPPSSPAPVSVAPRRNLTGASFLANMIRQQQAAIKQQLAQAGTEMQAAMTELQDVANEATNQVKAVKAETADLKAALGLNSNGEPG